MSKECATCANLSDCHEVNEQMITEGRYCGLFAVAEQQVLSARADIIKECGLEALRYAIPHKQLSAKPKARRRKRHV
jgi:hypothetical protein